MQSSASIGLISTNSRAKRPNSSRRAARVAGSKAESDDPRDSLSYKLRKLLALEARQVLCTDPYVPDPTLVPLERVLAESDILFVATPHKAYRELPPIAGKRVVDVWNCLQKPQAP